MWLVSFLLLFSSSFGFSSFSSPTIELQSSLYSLPINQLEALQDLYYLTNGDEWNWQQPFVTYGYPWNNSSSTDDYYSYSNPCSQTEPWQGVLCNSTCETSPCTVTALVLSKMNLQGPLPSSIANLTSLNMLNLCGNDLTGNLPSTIGLITSLTTLNLSRNHFSGTIPESLSSLSNLTTLSLVDNYLHGNINSLFSMTLPNLQQLFLDFNGFTGTLPSNLQFSSSLIHLSLGNNQFNGTIPEWLDGLHLQQLKSLTIRWNHFTGPLNPSNGNESTLCTFKEIKVLELPFNHFSSSIPACLGDLPEMLLVDISNNALTNTIPDSFWYSTSLIGLLLSYNQLTGTLPSILFTNNTNNRIVELNLDSNQLSGSLSSFFPLIDCAYTFPLQALLLSYNRFTGSLPTLLPCLDRLYDFSLSGNRLTGELPLALLYLPSLQILSLDDNQLTGSLSIPYIENSTFVSQLTEFEVNDNYLSGKLLEALVNFTSPMSPVRLNEIYVGANRLTGTVPSSICTVMPFLAVLSAPQNEMTGSFTDEFNDNCLLLESFIMATNQLTGTLSDMWGYYPLNLLELQSNHFSQTLPDTFTSIPLLQVLSLDNNILSGSITDTWTSGTYLLTEISMSHNSLTGPLPISMALLPAITEIVLIDNQLTGTIPIEWGQMASLSILQLNVNKLTQSIPSSICNLTGLIILGLDANQLTGTIPQCIDNMKSLQTLGLTINYLTGTIHDGIMRLPALRTLYLSGNLLTGSIPSNIGDGISLTDIYLSRNLLTSTLPSSLQYLTGLVVLEVFDNELSGTVPDDLFVQLTRLILLYLNQNTFTGMIPSSITTCSELHTFDVAHNLLSGSIDMLSELNELIELIVSDNLFMGSISSTFNNLLQLQVVELYNNSFSGPLFFTGLPALVVFYVDNNQFTGTVPSGLVNPLMEALTLNNNQFTGSIPYDLFSNGHRLLSVVLAINCFTGTIPVSICNVTNLIQLSMDGLHSASSCSSKILPWYSGSGLSSGNGVGGTIPECLWSLPLQLLTLSGNSFTGSIVSVANGSLGTVVLSNNLFTGTIPSWLTDDTTVTYLDLSFNRLGGVLPTFNSRLSDSPVLYLQDNRLSGWVPSSLLSLATVNILEGNMIACNLDRNDLPKNDPTADSYMCDSESTNISLITFSVAFVVCLAVIFVLIHCCVTSDNKEESLHAVWDKWVTINSQTSNVVVPSDLKQISSVMYWFCRVSLMTSVIILLPLYLAMGLSNEANRTYLHRYIWQISGLYMQSWGWAMVFMVVLLIFAAGLLGRLPLLGFAKSGSSEQTKGKEQFSMSYSSILVLMIVIILNIVIVLTINTLYVVAVVSDSYSVGIIMILTLLLSLFKLIWNVMLVNISTIVCSYSIDLSSWTITLLSLFNNLVVPLLAEGFASPNCFEYAVSAPPEITVNAARIECLSVVALNQTNLLNYTTYVSCETSVHASMFDVDMQYVYTPPFHYSYQCGASLISLFVPVFIYRCILAGPVELLIQYLLYRYRESIFHGERLWQRLLANVVPPMWKHLSYFDVGLKEDEKRDELLMKKLRVRVGVNCVTDVMIMLAFGTFFPPLTWLMILCMCKDMVVYRLLLHRWTPWLVSETSTVMDFDDNQTISVHTASTNTTIAFDGLGDEVMNGLWIAVVVSLLVWSLVLFDMIGNVTGVSVQSLSIAITMVLFPLIVLLLKLFYGFSMVKKIPDQQKTEFEMTVSVDHPVSRVVNNPLVGFN